MKNTSAAFFFLSVFLTGALLQAQDRSGGYIVWSRTNGREELRVPTNGGQAPSTVFNGTILATGAAANILSERTTLSSSVPSPIPTSASPPANGAPRVSQTIIYDDESNYLGTASLVTEGVYITAAHVIDQLGESSLNALLQRLNIPTASAGLYQFVHQSRPLDVVVILNKNIETASTVSTVMQVLAQEPQPQSGAAFSLVHYTLMDNQLIEQQSEGSLSVSQDRNQLYLSNNRDAHLTWGSSGAVVFAQKTDPARWSMSGVVQCVVRNETAVSAGRGETSYFRALSVKLLAESELQPITLERLQGLRSHYNLEACGPVDAKKGGGG